MATKPTQRASRRYFVAAASACVLALATRPAPAFERQWHVGGGLGAAAPSDDDSLAPVLGLHLAYGLSDVFDARLELQASPHAAAPEGTLLAGARFGLAYKVDVIEWIPYAGLSAGGFAWFAPDAASMRPSVGAFGGLDYAASRHFGIGVLAGGDYVFAAPALTLAVVLARAEYRFGW